MIVELEQNSPEWLEYRKSKFNASEAGSVMGCGFKKRKQLAEEKYLGKATYQNKAMQQGHEYEPRIREWIEAQQMALFNPCVMMWDKDERYSASLDGFNDELETILEIKFSGGEYEYVAKHDKPSDKYYWQVQHQLMVSGAKRAIFAVGRVNDSFELEVITCEVKPNAKDMAHLRANWESFFKEYSTITDDAEQMSVAELEQWQSLSDEIAQKQAEFKQLETELNELKAKAIEKANGREMKVAELTFYKVERKPSYDYKAYCASKNLVPSDEFLKAGSVSMAVRITA